MTLDVGYAEFRLPDDTEVGLIDVPGHEKLVRTMVAGATSMDLALLVIAADDGPMLQTREHVDILDLLGIRRVRRRDDEGRPRPDATTSTSSRRRSASCSRARRSRARRSCASRRRPARASRRCARRSSRRSRRSTTAARTRARSACRSCAPSPRPAAAPSSRASRWPDASRTATPSRCCPRAGRPRARHPGAPPRRDGRERGPPRRARARPTSHAEAIERGMVVAAAGTLTPVPRFSARLRVLSPRHRAARARDGGPRPRRRRPGGGAAPPPRGRHRSRPGSVTAVELQGERPFLVAPGDRFVLRAENASESFGGGVVVERLEQRLPAAPRGARGLDPRARGARRRPVGARPRVAQGGRRAGPRARADRRSANVLRFDALAPYVEALVREKQVVRAGRGRLFDVEGFGKLRRKVVDVTVNLHKKDPALPFLPLSTIRSAALPRRAAGARGRPRGARARRATCGAARGRRRVEDPRGRDAGRRARALRPDPRGAGRREGDCARGGRRPGGARTSRRSR